MQARKFLWCLCALACCAQPVEQAELRNYAISRASLGFAGFYQKKVVLASGNRVFVIDSETDTATPAPLTAPENSLSVVQVDEARGFAYISSSKSVLVRLNLADRSMSVMNFSDPTVVKHFVATRLALLPNSNYLLVLSHFHDRIAYLDTQTRELAWLSLGQTALKEVELSERMAVIMDEPGATLFLVPLANKDTWASTTAFSHPGHALFKLAYYSLFPEKDYFVAAAGDGRTVQSLFVFEATSSNPQRLKDLGRFQFSIGYLRYIHNTNYLVVGNELEAHLIDIGGPRATDAKIGAAKLVFPGISYFGQFPGAARHQFLVMSGYRQFASVVTLDADTACALGCSKCSRGADPGACTECSPSHDLVGSQCSPKCVSPQVFDVGSNSCVAFSPDGFGRVTPALVKPVPTGCRRVMDLDGYCTQCEPAADSFAYKTSCSIGKACPASSSLAGADRCQACNALCKSCSGWESDDCLACSSGYKKAADSSACVSDCSPGYYYNQNVELGRGGCQPCPIGCESCLAGHELKCTRCVNGFYLNGGYCDYFCPAAFVPSDSLRRCDICTGNDCTPCTPEQFVDNARCVKECPEGKGTYNSSSLCLPCHDHNCKFLRLPSGQLVVAATGRIARDSDVEEDDDGEDDDDEDDKKSIAWVFAVIGVLLFLCCVGALAFILYRRKTRPTQNNQQPKQPPPFLPDQNNVPLKQASTLTNAANELQAGPRVSRPEPLNFDDPKQENRVRANPGLPTSSQHNKQLARQDTGEL